MVVSTDKPLNLPWVEKYRPKNLSELVSHEDIIGTIRRFVKEKRTPHLLFYGPPGTGKTSAILAAAREIYSEGGMNSAVLELNASDDRGIDVVRGRILNFASTKMVNFSGTNVPFKLIILDEADAMTQDAQNALRRIIEKFTENVRFCLIGNYLSKIIPALQSRCTRFRFAPLQSEQIIPRLRDIVEKESLELTPDGEKALLALAHGDMRRILNILQSCSMAFPVVNEANIYACTGHPLPSDITKALESLLNDKLSESYHKIQNELQTNKGLSLIDILTELHLLVHRLEIPNKVKVYLLIKMADAEHRMLSGAIEWSGVDSLWFPSSPEEVYIVGVRSTNVCCSFSSLDMTEDPSKKDKKDAPAMEGKESDEGNSKELIQVNDINHNIEIEDDSDYEKLIALSLNATVAERLNNIYKTGKLSHSDLDGRALDALKEFAVPGAIAVLNQFQDSNLEHVTNKSAYLCGVMKTIVRSLGLNSLNGCLVKGPDEQKIKEILERTGYTLDVTTGQRKFGGPPPNWDGPVPGNGCEVFCGKIPRDLYEDELIPLFEKCGTIWDLRLMMDPMTGLNRGYAFITFTEKGAAQEAMKKLDSHDMGAGKCLKVNVSEPKTRLFIGNIPKCKDRDEIVQEFGKFSANLREVIIYSSPDDKKKNRGFCFLEYESHKAASLAKRRLETGRIKVWSCDIIVDWADPQEEPDEDTMAQVKVLYVRNLTVHVTEERLRETFETFGEVNRVKKIKDYGFVHFEERQHAIKAMEELGGKSMAVSFPPFPSFTPPYGHMAAGMYGFGQNGSWGRGGSHGNNRGGIRGNPARCGKTLSPIINANWISVIGDYDNNVSKNATGGTGGGWNEANWQQRGCPPMNAWMGASAPNDSWGPGGIRGYHPNNAEEGSSRERAATPGENGAEFTYSMMGFFSNH
ncbi:HNRNPR [Lepeophtheirus salmonis]|uniref:HNRNPR n=1 Tax=Lepeophtheirus salmonis TaxID=72036 RepID=A0A7R8D2I8_LEPSM|nr:HNRNPR [Lepeophtheirus salmonis]CAF2957236.1 HNRNPR [Lepeophtheirus salmonis]